MIVKNIRTKDKLELSYSEFRQQFKNEIEQAFQSYRYTEVHKKPWERLDDNTVESDFYFNVQWNFNHFSNSAWYIERM